MSNENKTYRIFLSAAEPSADAHCAGLITALQKSGCDIEFVGIGGAKMASAGCKLLENTTGRAVMADKAIIHAGYYYGLIRRINHFIKSNRLDVVIVCDSPSFNFHVAKAAKRANVKTLFYVAPQLWAWAGWRIRKLRKYCDKLCCILPFEEDWFRQKDIDALFVGNPLLDDLQADFFKQRRNFLNFKTERLKLAIVPGSRNTEIDSLWQPMQQIALRIKGKYPSVTFITAAVDAGRKQMLQAAQISGFDCQYAIDAVSNTAAKADFALVASGSATLQVAAAGCPMVIMYQSSKILWHLLGQWLIKTKHLSLVNILAGRELVPEFMPYFTSIEPIIQTVLRLLEDRDSLIQISNDLTKLTSSMADTTLRSSASTLRSKATAEDGSLRSTRKTAREGVAEIVIQMLSHK